MTKFYINSLGWVYLVIVLDWSNKKVVGYQLNLRSKADDWIQAVNITVQNNCPLGSREYNLHLMSDNGSQPTSEKFIMLLLYLELTTLRQVIPIRREMLILNDL